MKHALHASLVLAAAVWSAPGQSVRISEFMADNQGVLLDENGESSDWIELHNPTTSDVSLSGWHLSNDPDNATQWALPATVLPAGGYLVVFASGKDRTGPELHTNFRLAAGGEYLRLSGPGPVLVSAFAPAFPEQYPDISYGIQTDGANDTLRADQPGYLIHHTPGAANTNIPAVHPLYADDSLARIDLTLSQSVWDGIQASPPSTSEGSGTVRFRHGDIDVTVSNVGVRARGNTSLQHHPRSLRLSFDTFVPGQDLLGLEKMHLNANVNDPCKARSKTVTDLNRAIGIPASAGNHVALVLVGPDNNRSGADGLFFDAVYDNTQTIDDVFLKQWFGNSQGNLYKCAYKGGRADLTYRGPGGSSYQLDRYELKYQGGPIGNHDDLAAFIDIVNNTPTADFPAAIRDAFDVDEFLKALVIEVLAGQWDGYWGNYNNYHLYQDPADGRWHYLGFDYDNAFGIRWLGSDWANQNIYAWAHVSSTPLVSRIMQVDEFKRRYSFYMKQFLDTVYDPARLNPLVYHVRDLQTAPLPIDWVPTNCKATERSRYRFDWPYWDYNNFLDAYDSGQSGSVPNYYGMTQFIATRRASAYNQLQRLNIGPIIAPLQVSPSLPRQTDDILISTRVIDDHAVSNVVFRYAFNLGPTNSLVMTTPGDDVYTAVLPALNATGVISGFVEAIDDVGKSTFEPWDATNPRNITVGSPALDLAITELAYHPHSPTGNERIISTDETDYEFIELHNRGTAPVELLGYQLASGISFGFPTFSLPAGGYAVVVRSRAAFEARYGTNITVIGEFTGKLSNDSEPITLLDDAGNTVRAFTYDDNNGWPEQPDGDGSSLELTHPANDPSDGAGWRASTEYGGSPGAAGSGPVASVVINEVLTHTDLPMVDTIELFNPTDSAVDVSGWYLSDSQNPYRKFRIPDGTVLPALGYLSFNETSDFNTSAGTDPLDFALDGAQGDEVWLLAADGQSNLVRFVDAVQFGAAANGESLGRWPNGSGPLTPLIERTLGAFNSAPRVGPLLISEVMFHPPGADNRMEFVELYHAGTNHQNLSHWRLEGAIDFAFPAGLTLAPGDVLVVVPFDPTDPVRWPAFQGLYTPPVSLVAVGPYAGLLANEGEQVMLMRADEPPANEPTFYPLLTEDVAAFAPELPWPAEAAGQGASLMRVEPHIPGSDPTAWASTANTVGDPGVGPMDDLDGDLLPDIWEVATCGDTNCLGLADSQQYIRGTPSKTCTVGLSIISGLPVVELQTHPATGLGYFGLDRIYTLLEADLDAAGLTDVPSHTNLPATGDSITYTNTAPAPSAFYGVRITLE